MLSRLREHLGGAGLIVAVVALVAALSGGAIAANSGSSGDGKATASAKAKAKAKKGPRGPKGPKGDTGPAGLAGPAGPQGAKGDTGAAGSNGSNGSAGSAGKDGVSVTSAAASALECPNGGTKFTSSSGTSKACNGAPGEPWTAGGVLPPGETETGTVGGPVIGGVLAKEGDPQEGTTPVPVSIPIPLAEAPSPVFLKPGETDAEEGCPGLSPEGTPQADPGKLCVYMAQVLGNAVFQGFFDPTSGVFAPGASTTGTAMMFTIVPGSAAYMFGVWAVTAEEEA